MDKKCVFGYLGLMFVVNFNLPSLGKGFTLFGKLKVLHANLCNQMEFGKSEHDTTYRRISRM